MFFIYLFVHTCIHLYCTVILTLCINHGTTAVFQVQTIPENVEKHGKIMAKIKVMEISVVNILYFRSEKYFFIFLNPFPIISNNWKSHGKSLVRKCGVAVF